MKISIVGPDPRFYKKNIQKKSGNKRKKRLGFKKQFISS
jgi:hypothetical protein